MPFLNLDEEKEKRDKETKMSQQPEIEAEQEEKAATVFMFVLLAIIGLSISYGTHPDRFFSPAKLGSMVGTTLGMFLFSGFIAWIANSFLGKWKLAFMITFCLLAGGLVVSHLYEKERPKSTYSRP